MKNPELNYYPIDQGTKPIDGGGMVPGDTPSYNNLAMSPSESNIVPSTNGSVMKGGQLQSPNYSVGISGWIINADGNVEFNDGVFRGSLTATAIDIGGSDATSFHVDIDGNLWLGAATYAAAPFKVSNAGALTATGVTITGTVTATAGAIGGFDIGADYIRDVANSFGMASTVSGSDDVRFWAGATFANRATAPFRVTEAGLMTARQVSSTVSVKLRNLNSFTAGEAIDASSTPQLVYKSTSDGKVYKADADDNTKRRWFGFVDNAQNVSADATVEAAVDGIVSGFSGLTNGQFVYMTDTAGSISHTPSTTFVGRVGIAVSTTEILMFPKGIKQITGSASFACDTVDATTTVTTGFRCRLVLCFSTVRGSDASACNGDQFICAGAWSDSSAQGATCMSAVGEVLTPSGYVANVTGNTNGDIRISIGNVTETAFDIVFDAYGGGTGGSGSLFYVAFAE